MFCCLHPDLFEEQPPLKPFKLYGTSGLTPKRSVITAKIKAASGKFLFVFQCLTEETHCCRSTVFFNGGKSDTFAVDACACCDVVLVKVFILIRIGDFTKPGICMCGKSGKFLIFQNKFPVRILVLFLRGIVCSMLAQSVNTLPFVRLPRAIMPIIPLSRLMNKRLRFPAIRTYKDGRLVSLRI